MSRLLASEGSRKIRVAFLMLENQKWSSQAIYDALEADSGFEPLILASTHTHNARQGRSGIRTTLEDNVAFAERRGMSVEKAYDPQSRKFVPLERFSPDIVFYEQPYGLPPEHAPGHVAGFALTCYVPYGYGIYLARNSGQKGTPDFSEYIWRTFLESEDFLRCAGQEDLLRQKGIVPVGYPKMDAFACALVARSRTERTGQQARPRIIFAPHHSVSGNHQDRYGTFAWSGRRMLEFARATPEAMWIFKPHPKLRESLIALRLMSAEEVDDYFHQWETLENAETVLDGNYLDCFVDSDGMITDSGSFLLEYLFTGCPLLLLKSSVSAGYSPFGEKIAASLYQANDFAAVEDFVAQVMLGGGDSLRTERARITPKLNPHSGADIVKYLRSEFSSSWMSPQRDRAV